MITSTKSLGLDIGGSHVTASIIDLFEKGKQPLRLFRKDINSLDSASIIIEAISNSIKDLLIDGTTIGAVGIAFPGPFDYKKGVSAIANVGGKFEKTFALHIQQALRDRGLTDTPIQFSNDAHCFAIGAYSRHQLSSQRTVFLTLGTGFGSSFMENGKLVTNHPALPAIGAFYHESFLASNADEYFSTRWFQRAYKQNGGEETISVEELAQTDSESAALIFNEFGANLGSFLMPWLKKFECDELVIGGNISKANELFVSSLKEQLGSYGRSVNIIFCADTEECILTGAAHLASQETRTGLLDIDIRSLRKTTQNLLPLTSIPDTNSGYNIFPSVQSNYEVYRGFNSLAEKLCDEKIVIIDGYSGVLWEIFREHLHTAIRLQNKSVFWYDINACLKSPHEINEMLADHLNGEDPVFGNSYLGNLSGFFDDHKLSMLQPDSSVDLCIVYGTGAALSNWKGKLVYVDLPKNEIQYRMRAGSVTNIGCVDLFDDAQMYKRSYFIDWPVLNRHKEKLLANLNFIVDEQRIDEVTWMDGVGFRNSLDEILEQPLRARPWFEAGIWGGNWMKENIAGLNQEEVNYAWSFELITPENGIVIEGNQHLMEVSFDFLLFQNNKKLLGKAANRFGTKFPIRFDFLDTFDGGNLSIQCHPRVKYIRERFGEDFTQDETYYILDCKPDASVYLGFQEDINPYEFKTALLQAQNDGLEMPVENYVQKLEAHKHDLFLIPNGTVHASGKNNMILEISSTPYIFTFKMYDWLRLDLNRQPRPINIEHAFNNLYFDRAGDYVKTHLVSTPQTVTEWRDGRRVKLPTHEEHFYEVERYEFRGSVSINTNEQCHIGMLVQGSKIEVAVNQKKQIFHYAETFIIPAAVQTYELSYEGNDLAFVVVAFVKD